MSVQGPIARSIRDVRLGLNTLSKRSSDDPLWVNVASSGRKRQAPYKIGWFVDVFGDGVDSEVADATHKAVAALKEAGHELIEMPAPNALEVAKVWGDILFTETNALGRDAMVSMGSKEIQRLYESYAACYTDLDVKGLLAAMQQRIALQRVWAQMFDTIDVFLMPVSGQKPFLNDQDFNSPELIPEMMKAQRFLYVINLLGLPSASVPIETYGRIPVGVQLVGAMHDDAVCLDVAEDLERIIEFKGLDALWSKHD